MNLFERLAGALRNDEAVALATQLGGTRPGAKLLVDREEAFGELSTPGLTYAVTAEARARLATAETGIRIFGADGEPAGTDVRVFIQAFTPKPEMYIFGAVDFSRAMATAGKFLGYRVTVIDARPVFTTKARLPDADEIVVQWPDEFLGTARVDERTAIVVLTHDEKFDIPLLQVALRTNAGYIGAMGSRSTHRARIEKLKAAGVTEQELGRLSSPLGLDLGARTPEETAVSIAAEIVALRYGRPAGRLVHGADPIHGARATIRAN